MSSSTGSHGARPPKPYDDFPLSPHPSGHWQKKINGKVRYFGPWGKRVDGVLTVLTTNGEPDGQWAKALALFNAQKTDLFAGRAPRVRRAGGEIASGADGMTVKELVNDFLLAKYERVTAGTRSPRTFAELKATGQRIVDVFGRDRLIDELGPSDFRRLRRAFPKWGPTRRGNEIGRVRSYFAYAFKNGYLKAPMQFGTEFERPDEEEYLALPRRSKLFTAEEIRQLLAKTDQTAKAMVLLAVNCAFGNTDIAKLPFAPDPDRDEVIDLDAGILCFPRSKTKVRRKAVLWPETVEALREYLKVRPKPIAKGAADAFFVTRLGRPYLTVATTTVVKTKADEALKVVANAAHPVTRLFGDTLKAAGIKSNGRGYYALRHVFRTVADAVHDTNAINCVMGHKTPGMARHYIHGIANERIKAVTDHVRAWLFDGASTSPTPGGNEGAFTGPAAGERGG